MKKQGITRPSATLFREEGLRIWLLPRLTPLPPPSDGGVKAMNEASVKCEPTTDHRPPTTDY